MFTGLIEEVGRVQRITRTAENHRLTVSASRLTRELKKGDSISVSGVCLTAVEVTPKSFSADLAAETWARTSFSRIQENSPVNLELPMHADGRLGGHLVQGHVDGIGRVLDLKKVNGGEDYWLRLEIPAELERYVVYKGSIAIEGISLTVAKLEQNRVTIAIIPHTFEATNLHMLQPGDPVNLEVDLIAKYVEKMLQQGSGRPAITLERLVSEGF
jgi:riboflavin synthase